MSSLRVETLRLCWLEAFIEVGNEENISQAARHLGVDQSTVSRYIQALEKWVGKRLIEPGTISDPEDPRLSVGITPAGRELFNKAEGIVTELNGLRDESAKRRELVEDIVEIVEKMQADRHRKVILPVTKLLSDNIDGFQLALDSGLADAPLDLLLAYRARLRAFFNRYEIERNKEKRRSKKLPAPALTYPDG